MWDWTFVYSCRLLLSNPKIYSCQEIAKSSLTQCKPGWPLSSTSRLALIWHFEQYFGMSLQPLAMVEWQQKWPCGAGYVSPYLSPQSGHSLTKPNRNVFHILRVFVMVLWWMDWHTKQRTHILKKLGKMIWFSRCNLEMEFVLFICSAACSNKDPILSPYYSAFCCLEIENAKIDPICNASAVCLAKWLSSLTVMSAVMHVWVYVCVHVPNRLHYAQYTEWVACSTNANFCQGLH